MKIFLVLAFGLIVLFATAQEHDHDDHRNHFGVGLGASALLSGSDFMPNIHLHYLRKRYPSVLVCL